MVELKHKATTGRENTGRVGPGPRFSNGLWNRASLFHVMELSKNDARGWWGEKFSPRFGRLCQGQLAQVLGCPEHHMLSLRLRG